MRRSNLSIHYCLSLIILVLFIFTTDNVSNAAGQPSSPDQNNTIARADVTVIGSGRIIPAGFLGLSHEWGSAQSMIGPPDDLNRPYVQLLKNLIAYGNGPFVLRIGGNSTDFTGEATPATVSPFAALYHKMNVRFILGLDLGKDDPQLALEQAQSYLAGMPHRAILGFEIGNEPDLFRGNGHRPRSYTIQDYMSDFARFRKVLHADPKTRSVKLIGPAWAILGNLVFLPEFIHQEHKYLAMITQHWYPNNVCGGKPAPPPSYLLSNPPAESGPRAVARFVSLAHRNHLPFRMGEMNSFACGGAHGVSDRFVAALWAIDAMFRFAEEGVDGVNFHTGNGDNYAVFAFHKTGHGRSESIVPEVKPLYYALLFFAEATAHHSHLLPVNVRTDNNVRIYAMEDQNGVVRLAILNKETQTGGRVEIRLSRKMGRASFIRLRAPEYAAANGITLAGQTFDGSTNGRPVGKRRTERIEPDHAVFQIDAPPFSATLLTVHPR